MLFRKVLTFATTKLLNGRTITNLVSGEYNIDYVGDTLINIKDLEPISNDQINYNTTDKVIRVEFSLKGAKTNKTKENLIYDVMLSDMDIDCSLLNKYTKWNLYKNGSLLSTGTLDPLFDGNVLTDNITSNVEANEPAARSEENKTIIKAKKTFI